MNKVKFLFVILAAAGVIGVILSAILLVSAIRFGELGRVLLYSVTAIVCAELAAISITKLLPKKEDKDQQ